MQNKIIVILLVFLNIKASDPAPSVRAVAPVKHSDIKLSKIGFDVITLDFYATHMYATYRALLREYGLPHPSRETAVKLYLTVADSRLRCGGSIRHSLDISKLGEEGRVYRFSSKIKNGVMKDGVSSRSVDCIMGGFNESKLNELVDQICSTTSVHETLEMLNGRMACPGEASTCPGHFINFHASESLSGERLQAMSASVDMTGSDPTTCTWTAARFLSPESDFGNDTRIIVKKRPQFRTPAGK